MMTLDEITKKVLEQIDASGFKQSGAFNLRHNGIALCHGDSEHIKIKKKQDKPGIDIYIDGKTDGEDSVCACQLETVVRYGDVAVNIAFVAVIFRRNEDDRSAAFHEIVVADSYIAYHT